MYLIENASADTLVIEASYTPVESFWYSIKPFTEEAYDQHVYLPKSKKSLNGGGIDFFSWGDVLYIYAYLCDDVMRMSDEEFQRINPVKHMWIETRESWAAKDWTIVYPANEEDRTPYIPPRE